MTGSWVKSLTSWKQAGLISPTQYHERHIHFIRQGDEDLLSTQLAVACSQAGCRAFIFPVEVGSRGYTGPSAQRLIKTLGIRGVKLKRTVREIAEEAEQGSWGRGQKMLRKDPETATSQ